MYIARANQKFFILFPSTLFPPFRIIEVIAKNRTVKRSVNREQKMIGIDDKHLSKI